MDHSKILRRFIQAADEEACRALAAQYFNCPPNFIGMLPLPTPPTDGSTAVIAFLVSNGEAVKNANGAYLLFYEEDGVYVEFLPPSGTGKKADADARAYIKKKKIDKLSESTLDALLRQGYGRACIAPPQEEYFLPEQVVVAVTPDQMSASVVLVPPEPGGELLTEADVLAALAEAKVVYGIDQALVTAALEQRAYAVPMPVAHGLAPVDGVNGEIIYHFRTSHSLAPTVDESTGRVDYFQLDLFDSVTAGQLLVTRKLATPGTPGSTVTGRALAPRPGKDVRMPGSKNTVLDSDSTQMTAKINGRVDLINLMVVVSDVFAVPGDADLSVGNIDFTGDVVVRGAVISGLTIKASGGIEIFGPVGDATLIAGGSIVLRSGMQGADHGVIEAGGDVTARYIERTRVTAGGTISVEAFMHSTAMTDAAFIATGKRGLIVGSEVNALTQVTAVTIGSSSDSKTVIFVGISPAKRLRLGHIEKEITQLTEKLDQFEKLLAHFGRMPQQEQENRAAMRREVVLQRLQIMQRLKELREEREELTDHLQKAQHGKVSVRDRVYPGVKISISSQTYAVTREVTFATFRYSAGDIIFTPYEV